MARHLVDEPRAVAFIGAWAGGGALLADRPAEVASAEQDPFALLDQTAQGMWAGWLGYQLGAELEQLPAAGSHPTARPPAWMARYEVVCRADGEGRWWLETVGPPEPAEVARWQARLAEAVPLPAWSAGPITARPGRTDHIGAVEETVLRIAAGQLYQANVCLRLEAPFTGSALGLWCQAGQNLRPARAAFVSDENGAVASLSPETFLVRHGRTARSEPLKGTRPLTEDGRLDLVSAEKDRAEHVMIVDLVRNDLGRVCQPGTVQVARLLEAEPLAGVWHLVSAVQGTLAKGCTDAELVRACFPPGSVTGAPKVAAEALCARLEPTARQTYCGAIGFASADHGLELNVAIRTFEIVGERLWLGVGGGVVAGSDGATEWEECRSKAAPLLAAADMPAWYEPGPEPHALDTHGDGATGPAIAQRASCFDTMLVVDGRVLERSGHLARFAAASDVEAGPAVDAAATAHPKGTFRLRVNQADGVATTTMAPVPRPPVLDGAWSVTDIALVVYAGGYGACKWSDRRALEVVEHQVAPLVPVLCDVDGAVLEACWGNVFVIVEGRLCTPSLDGRILAGITRRALLDEAIELGVPVRVGRLDTEELLAADAVLLTSSVRGLTWVRSIDGTHSFERPDPLVALLAGALRRRWAPPEQRY